MIFANVHGWEHIRRRYEAWWNGQLDGPILRVTAPGGPGTPPVFAADGQDLVDWCLNPEMVLPRLEKTIASTYYAGDAFPCIDPVSFKLAAIEAAYLGAPYKIIPGEITGWADPIIQDWDTRPRLEVDEYNPWWQATRELLKAATAKFAERAAIAIPDLQGGGEILALLRGSQQLAMDLVDCPEHIVPALEEINAAWHFYFNSCYEIIHHWQEGYVDWLEIWSDRPMVTVECDFSVMISPRMFRRYFLPAVEQQMGMVERSIFHLDGPGAIPHLDALLDLPGLHGIQWVPTPDRPRPLDWIPLLQRIQVRGKRVVVDCTPQEVIPLLQALVPAQTLLTTRCASPEEADALMLSTLRT